MYLLCSQLSAGYTGGVGLVDTLEIMAKGQGKKSIKRIAERLAHCLRRGATLGQAAHWERRYLPEVAVAMLELGERAGQLETVLNELAGYYKDRVDNHRAIIQQVTYPALLVVCIAFIIPIIKYVVISSIGGSSEEEVAMAVLTMLFRQLAPLLFLLGALWVLGRYLPVKRWLRELCYRMRIFSSMTRSFAVARYCGVLAILLKTDLPLHDIITLAARTAGNASLERDFAAPAPLIKEGSSLAKAFYEVRSLPIQAHLQIAVGEESGETEEAFRNIAKDLYSDTIQKLRNLTVILGVVLLLLIVMGRFGVFAMLFWLIVDFVVNMTGG
jgi:type II secretory pathway component PulF